jgi:hypothetical protein
MALFFAPLKNDYAAVQSRMGFIQEFAVKGTSSEERSEKME